MANSQSHKPYSYTEKGGWTSEHKPEAEVMRCLESLKTIPRSGEALVRDGSTGREYTILEAGELTAEERKGWRQSEEQTFHERAGRGLPESWNAKKIGRFLVGFSCDEILARRKQESESFFLALSKGKGVCRTDMGFDNLKTCDAEEVWRVFRQEFGLEDAESVRKLEVAWHEHVDGLIARNTSTSGKEKTGYDALETGRPLRVRRFFQKAVDAGSQSPHVFLEQAAIRLADGKTAAALELMDRAIALDPLNGAFYGRKSRALKDEGDKDEGARLVRLAQEIGDDDPWTGVDLGDVAGDDGRAPGGDK